MAGSFGSSGDEDFFSGINVTPLVDVVLVLLIIFLITAPVLYQSAIHVQLPSAKTGEKTDQSPINFSVTKEGQLFWEKEPLDWDALKTRLAGIKERAPTLTAIINADQATPHGTVVKLMDTLRDSGLTRFALSVSDASSK